MKVKTTNNTTFNPITLEITIESEDELKNLWAALNCDSSQLTENGRVIIEYSADNDEIYKLFDTVDEYLRKLGLKKE